MLIVKRFLTDSGDQRVADWRYSTEMGWSAHSLDWDRPNRLYIVHKCMWRWDWKCGKPRGLLIIGARHGVSAWYGQATTFVWRPKSKFCSTNFVALHKLQHLIQTDAHPGRIEGLVGFSAEHRFSLRSALVFSYPSVFRHSKALFSIYNR